MYPEDTKKRIMNRLNIGLPDECWGWTGACNKKGYGRIKINGILYSPYRVLLEIEQQKIIPRNMDVCHKCDNPKCCNIKHLFIGTRQDNMIDCKNKRRLHIRNVSEEERKMLSEKFRGEGHPSHKLTNNIVKYIKFLHSIGFGCREMGRMLKVSHTTISQVCNGKRWNHVI